jgi:hypothetical protein
MRWAGPTLNAAECWPWTAAGLWRAIHFAAKVSNAENWASAENGSNRPGAASRQLPPNDEPVALADPVP